MTGAADRDPRHHTQKMQKALQYIKDHLRDDIEKVDRAPAQGDVRNLRRSAGRIDQGLPRLRAEERKRLAQSVLSMRADIHDREIEPKGCR